MHLATIGQGPTLVLVHGWSNSWVGWQRLALELAKDYQVVMIDMPGFGDSGDLPEYSIDLAVEYLEQVVTGLELKTQALVGGSLGSLVVARWLELYPTRAESAILMGAIFEKLSAPALKQVYKHVLLQCGRHELLGNALVRGVKAKYTAYLVEKFVNAYHFDKQLVDRYNLPGRKKMRTKSYIDMGLSAYDFRMEQWLAQTNKCVLIIQGEADKYVNLGYARQVISKLPLGKVRLEVVACCGHNPAYEQPQVAAELIRGFVR